MPLLARKIEDVNVGGSNNYFRVAFTLYKPHFVTSMSSRESNGCHLALVPSKKTGRNTNATLETRVPVSDRAIKKSAILLVVLSFPSGLRKLPRCTVFPPVSQKRKSK